MCPLTVQTNEVPWQSAEMCYKSSKEPLLDASLLRCSVDYKEKQLKRKKHKQKIIPVGRVAIVLGLQSREETEQWLKIFQELKTVTPNTNTFLLRGELGERYPVASAAQTAMLKFSRSRKVFFFSFSSWSVHRLRERALGYEVYTWTS